MRSLPQKVTLLLVLGDLSMFLLAAFLATTVVQTHWKATVDVEQVRISTAIYAAIWLPIFWRLGLYRRSFAFRVRDEFYYTTAALCIGSLPQFVVFSIFPSISTSRAALGLSLILSIVSVGMFRAVAHKVYEIATRNGMRLVVIGDPQRLDGAVDEFCRAGNFRVYWIAIRDFDSILGPQSGLTVERIKTQHWFQQALAWRARRLIFTEPPNPDALPYMIAAAFHHGMEIAIAPSIRAHAYTVAIDRIGTQILVVPEFLGACRPGARLFKRLFDLAAGVALLVLFGPAMIAITLIMLMFDRSGPLFYSQVRVGRNGRPFEILKFRTMRTDAERDGARFASRGDPRVTKIGRFLRRTSLDELPQLFNVLRGDMSIVGPRPERPVFVQEFRRQYARYDERHLVKPGLTALSHVQMNRIASMHDIAERLKHDLFYIENWSPFLDLSIIVKTGVEFLFHKAA